MRHYVYTCHRTGELTGQVFYGPLSGIPHKQRHPIKLFECDAENIVEADKMMMEATSRDPMKDLLITCDFKL